MTATVTRCVIRTILLAWIWANFFFTPCLATLGPAGTQADLRGGLRPSAPQSPL